MKAILKNELSFIILLVVLFILFASLSPSNLARLILGLPLVLFFPGYALIASLFPRKGRLGGTERALLGFGLTIAVVPLPTLSQHASAHPDAAV